MTPTVESSIWAALRSRLAHLRLSPPMPISWPNELFIAPLTGYLKVEHIPNRTLRSFIPGDAPHHFRGILQVSVMSKLNEIIAVAIERAGDVAGHFPSDLQLTSGAVSVRITRHPSLGPAQQQATHLMIPVSVEYEAWA